MPFVSQIHSAATSIVNTVTRCLSPPNAEPVWARPRPGPVRPAPLDYSQVYSGTPDQHANRAAVVCNSDWMAHALNSGADINGKTQRHGDSLMMRVMTGSNSVNRYRLISKLMSTTDQRGNNVDVLNTNKAGNNAIHVAAASHRKSFVDALLSPMLDQSNGYTRDDLEEALDTRNAAGQTPQEIAAASGNQEITDAFADFRELLLRERLTG